MQGLKLSKIHVEVCVQVECALNSRGLKTDSCLVFMGIFALVFGIWLLELIDLVLNVLKVIQTVGHVNA